MTLNLCDQLQSPWRRLRTLAAAAACCVLFLRAAGAEPTPYVFFDALSTSDNGTNLPPFGLALDGQGNWYMSSAGGVNALSRYSSADAVFDVLAPAGSPLGNPACIVVGPDGHLYTANAATSSVTRFNASTGAFIDAFVPSGSGGLTGALGLTFGPDGDLYVASRDNDSVLRYHGTTGAFLGTFVAPGSGGLDVPLTPTFGPDGHLYVTSRDTNSVLRYDGSTGASLGTFIAPGSGGLLTPNSLVFGPDHYAYLTSRDNHAVLRYDGATGAFVDAVVPSGAYGVSVPRALAFDDDGRLYVASVGSNQVVRLAPKPELRNPAVRMWDIEATIYRLPEEGAIFDELRLGDTVRARFAFDLNAPRAAESTPPQAFYDHALEFGVVSATIENPRTGESYEFLPAGADSQPPHLVAVSSGILGGWEEDDASIVLTQPTTAPAGFPGSTAQVTVLLSGPEGVDDLSLPDELDLDDWPFSGLIISPEFLASGIYAQIVSLTPVDAELVLADADADLDVDGSDFLVWQRTLAASAGGPADFDRNARVDATDLAFLRQQFGHRPMNQAIPEPSALMLVLVAVSIAAGVRRR